MVTSPDFGYRFLIWQLAILGPEILYLRSRYDPGVGILIVTCSGSNPSHCAVREFWSLHCTIMHAKETKGWRRTAQEDRKRARTTSQVIRRWSYGNYKIQLWPGHII